MGRKSIAAGAAAFLILLLGVGSALAGTYTSPSKITTTGPNTLVWNGQGVTDGSVDLQCQDSAKPKEYLLWVFTTDGGSASNPVLQINGTTYDQYTQQGGNYHFFTPYYKPADIKSASVEFNALTLGNGDWNLVISHGCDGGGHGQGAALDVSKTAAGEATQTFTWDVAKTVDNAKVYTAGGADATFNYTVTVTHDAGTVSDVTVSGEIDVFNPNGASVTGVDIVDTLPGGTCDVTGGSGATVDPGDTFFPYSCTLTALPGSPISNTATVSWADQTLSDGDQLVGGSSQFVIPVAFTTTKVDDCVSVTDSLGGKLGQVCSSDPSPKTFDYAKTFSDPAGTCTSHDNTATITTNTTGTTDTASQTVEDCQGADLTVTKTATPSFNLAYAWSIEKDVDKTLVKQVGGSATFDYTVAVKHDAGTESNWQVGGTIKVANPNDWEDAVVDVTDALPNASCAVTGGTDVTVPASSSVTLDYACTFGSNPGSGTNTATATWDADAAHTPSASATGSADFTFGDPTKLIDECVSVTDSYAGTLGSACVGNANPKSFTYSRTVPIPASACKSYDNTATFTTNDTGATGSDSQTVTVCGPADTGALTMGFWQNKNGQGIIKAGASIAGVCSSGTWLRQYAAFADLSTPATCTQVATYVTNVIKAANASGASMNAMLKAQMLATSLDVYFSDPALGGNKIGAPAPIGGVAIDLTMICKGGFSSCSSGYEDVSSAFGGASSMTISQMLAYAASQSNPGGTAWYGQVKATQALAKDAFDAINNGAAFAP